jgi:hypothetical protein
MALEIDEFENLALKIMPKAQWMSSVADTES